MKRTIKFYTDEQNQAILKDLHKGLKIIDIAKKYAKLWNRPQPSLYIKIMKMSQNPQKTRAAKKGITLPKGWSFDIANIKRVVIHSNNSATLYF